MEQEDIVQSPTEKRIGEALKNHPQALHLRAMMRALQHTIDMMAQGGLQQDILAVAAVTHLASMLAAQKIAGAVPHALIDLLLDDLVDTVRNRSIVGIPALHTKQ